MLAALAVTAAGEGSTGIRALGRRVAFLGEGWRWIAIAVFVPITVLRSASWPSAS
jgi:hypothetical protein